MTSFRQFQANRQNAQKSTGPTTTEGKQKSRCNAVRHGLTAETVIGQLEDAEDYKAFEAAIIADYDAQSAVERELVLRLASLLWRLRRGAKMETGLFEIQIEHMCNFKPHGRTQPVYPVVRRAERANGAPSSNVVPHPTSAAPSASQENSDRPVDVTTCFLGLADMPNYALDRLSRYEAILWRQAWQIMYALNSLGRPKQHERSRFAFLRTRPHRQTEEY